eukprot:3830668-Rhodomonas_salina.2
MEVQSESAHHVRVQGADSMWHRASERDADSARKHKAPHRATHESNQPHQKRTREDMAHSKGQSFRVVWDAGEVHLNEGMRVVALQPDVFLLVLAAAPRQHSTRPK